MSFQALTAGVSQMVVLASYIERDNRFSPMFRRKELPSFSGRRDWTCLWWLILHGVRSIQDSLN